MKKNTFEKFAFIVGFLILVAAIVIGGRAPSSALGSVSNGNDYHSTTTDATYTTPLSVATGPGTFGSVIITTAGTGKLAFYDATTTNKNLRTKQATTTLAVFNVTTTVGTYTFDSQFYDGLIAEFTGASVASSTITYK